LFKTITANPRAEAMLIIASVALAGAALGLALATAAGFAAISLGWSGAYGMLYLGTFGGAAIGGAVCYHSSVPRRFRLQCILATASLSAFGCMIVVLGSGTLVMPLLPHDRATADLAFAVTFWMHPFAMIGGAIGGGALGPRVERTMIPWGRAMVDRFGHRRPG
jgi:hypothetical protein